MNLTIEPEDIQHIVQGWPNNQILELTHDETEALAARLANRVMPVFRNILEDELRGLLKARRTQSPEGGQPTLETG